MGLDADPLRPVAMALHSPVMESIGAVCHQWDKLQWDMLTEAYSTPKQKMMLLSTVAPYPMDS